MCVLPVAILLALSGCATIMGEAGRIPVSTDPPGATVFVDNIPVGKTPMLITLDRKRSSGAIRIEMPEFAPVGLVRAKHVSGWVWVDLCTSGPIGILIDLVTGNWGTFEDGPIMISLSPSYDADPDYQPGPPSAGDSLPTQPPSSSPPPAASPGRSPPSPAASPGGDPPAASPSQRRR